MPSRSGSTYKSITEYENVRNSAVDDLSRIGAAAITTATAALVLGSLGGPVVSVGLGIAGAALGATLQGWKVLHPQKR